MKKIILCNTYYQLIFAMHLNRNLFYEDEVSLVMSDHSKGAKKVCENLNKMNIFKKVNYMEVKWIRAENKRNILKTIVKLKNENIFSFVGNEKFDEFVFYNFDFVTNMLFQKLYKKNKDIKVTRFEEGILTYNLPISFSIKMKMINIFNNLCRRPILTKKMSGFYCFYPSFYRGILLPIEIEPIKLDREFQEILINSFNLSLDEDSYNQKYIFFTSVYDFEGGEPIGEYELVCKVADIVGKENLLVKTHPRDVRTIYEDNGFIVDKNSDIPWEAIQLSRDFSDKVFLTATSGSVLAGSFMSENPPKTFFMHKCCNVSGNPVAQKSVGTIEELLNDVSLKDSLKTVSKANDVRDILV